jgi:hypothetical protein
MGKLTAVRPVAPAFSGWKKRNRTSNLTALKKVGVCCPVKGSADKYCASALREII